MNHPAIRALYEVVPAFRHEQLDRWVKEWTEQAYSRYEVSWELQHIQRDPQIFRYAEESTIAALAEMIRKANFAIVDKSDWDGKGNREICKQLGLLRNHAKETK